MYRIDFSDQAKKYFYKLEKKDQERIGSVLERIKFRPERFVEKLIGIPGYKLKVGKYRLIIQIDKGKLIILVIKIGHRKNIYDPKRK